MHGRLEIDGDLLASRFPLGIVDSVGEPNAAALDAGVVDQHIQPRKLGNRPFEQRDAARCCFDVTDMKRKFAVLALRLAEFVFAAAADNHVASRAKKTLGERKADS